MDMTNPPADESKQPGAPQPAVPEAGTAVAPEPPEPASAVQAPVPSWEGAQPPMPPAKLKLNVGFFLLGFFAPVVVQGLFGGLIALLSQVLGGAGIGILSMLLMATTPVIFVVGVVLFFKGKNTGNAKLVSFGKGVIWLYAVYALFALLLFGTCLINPAMMGG